MKCQGNVFYMELCCQLDCLLMPRCVTIYQSYWIKIIAILFHIQAGLVLPKVLQSVAGLGSISVFPYIYFSIAFKPQKQGAHFRIDSRPGLRLHRLPHFPDSIDIQGLFSQLMQLVIRVAHFVQVHAHGFLICLMTLVNVAASPLEAQGERGRETVRVVLSELV